jgi:hypothetical protein
MESEKPPPARKSKWRWVVGSGLVLVVIAALAGLTAPRVLRAHVDPLTREWSELGQMGYGLAEYASCNDGQLPAKLDDLASLEMGLGLLKFRNFRTGKHLDWKYFPGFGSNDRGDTIVVAAPLAFSKADGTFRALDEPSRMVLTLDGRKLILAEPLYMESIAEQSSATWRTSQSPSPKDPWRFLNATTWREPVQSGDSADPPTPAPDLASLIRRLDSGGTIQRDAADALTSLKNPPPEVATALLRVLGDAEIGYTAAMGLAVMSLEDASIAPRMIGIMHAGDDKSRYWAAVALEKIGLRQAREAVPLMTKALTRHGDDIQVTAAKALAGLGQDASVAVPELIAVLSDGDSWAAKCAIIALGRIGPPAHAAVPELWKIVESGDGYRMDAKRALWSIQPALAPRLIPLLIDEVAGQRNPSGPNGAMSGSFFPAIELLGRMGPSAAAAIPVLKDQLLGGAGTQAALALWRIEPTLLEPMTEIIAQALNDDGPTEDRFATRAERGGRQIGVYSGLDAVGMLWLMHPGRRDELRPVLSHLLHAWDHQNGLDRFDGMSRHVIPALEALLLEPIAEDLRTPTGRALQRIRTTDPGNW